MVLLLLTSPSPDDGVMMHLMHIFLGLQASGVKGGTCRRYRGPLEVGRREAAVVEEVMKYSWRVRDLMESMVEEVM